MKTTMLILSLVLLLPGVSFPEPRNKDRGEELAKAKVAYWEEHIRRIESICNMLRDYSDSLKNLNEARQKLQAISGAEQLRFSKEPETTGTAQEGSK